MALQPDYLQGLPTALEKLTEQLEKDLIEDISRRIAKAGEITDTAAYQLLRLKELGAASDYLEKLIADYTKLSEQQVRQMIFEAAQTDSEFYEEFYRKAAQPYTPYEYNDYLQQLTKAAVNQTCGELQNYTRSMGFSVRGTDGRMTFKPAAKAYRSAMDKAFMLAASGGVDYITAVRRATAEITGSGLMFVDYASGVRTHADVAARRALLTGVSQMTGQIAESNAAKLGTDVVEVTAHAGARPDHAAWQGKWFSLNGLDKRYPKLRDVTGYGTVTGLKGANCRHDFYPVIPGIDEPAYTAEQLANIDPPPVTIGGKTYTYYEAEQRQRYMERSIRKTKREIIAADATGDKDRMTEKAVLLRRQREEYKDFSEKAGLLTRNERTQAAEFGRSQASRSTAEYKKVLTLGNGDVTMGLKVNSFRNALADGKVNTSVDTKNQPKHVNGKVWKNQVKQAVQSGGKITPRSLLAKGLDPQDLINRYAGKGDGYNFRPNQKYPDEFITLPFVVGRTYDNSTGKYIETHRLQIKYNEKNGVHIFPVKEV